MFRQSLNRAVLRLRIETVSPLLIKAGDAGLDPAAADMTCVRTNHGRHGSTVYIPGSSLKGVLRSAVEAWLRSARLARSGQVQSACDPLGSESCGRASYAADRPDSRDIYNRHCLACRVFGSTKLKGRASVRDLYPFQSIGDLKGGELQNFQRANGTELRHGVAINRLTGAVQVGPFESEMVPPGVRFYGEIALENYQTWQLGVLAQAIDELHSGFAQLGSAKSRGFGVVQVTVEGLIHEQPLRVGEAPLGVGQILASAEEIARYGLLPESTLPEVPGAPHGLARRFEVAEGQTKAWLEAGLTGLLNLEGP